MGGGRKAARVAALELPQVPDRPKRSHRGKLRDAGRTDRSARHRGDREGIVGRRLNVYFGSMTVRPPRALAPRITNIWTANPAGGLEYEIAQEKASALG